MDVEKISLAQSDSGFRQRFSTGPATTSVRISPAEHRERGKNERGHDQLCG